MLTTPIRATASAARGLTVAPWIAAAVRGAIEAALLAAFVGAAAFVSSADAPPELQAYAPLLLWVFRFLEGLADQIDPEKTRRTAG